MDTVKQLEKDEKELSVNSATTEQIKKRLKDKNNIIETSFWESNIHILEQINDGENKFLLFNKLTGESEITNEYKYKDFILKPVNWDIINKYIFLPSGIVDFDEKELNKRIDGFIYKWLDIDEYFRELARFYIKISWLYDRLTTISYLRGLGDFGGGKTRFANTIGALCYRPTSLAGASSDAFIFRIIEKFKGTLIINELERINTDISGIIVNILNNGYEKGMGVGRIEGEGNNRKPQIFDVFSPKIITSREPFKDIALESRIISCSMTQTSRKDIPINLDEDFYIEAKEIRNMLFSYRLKVICDTIQAKRQDSVNADLISKKGGSDAMTLATLTTTREEKEVDAMTLATLSITKGSIKDLYLYNNLLPRVRQTLYPLCININDDEFERFKVFAEEYQNKLLMESSNEIEAIVAQELIKAKNNNNIYDNDLYEDEIIKPLISVSDLRKNIGEFFTDTDFKITPQYLGKKLKILGCSTKRFGNQNITCVIRDDEILEKLEKRYILSSKKAGNVAVSQNEENAEISDIFNNTQ